MAGLLLRVGAVLSRESVDQHRLKNGLKLVVRQEKALPLVGVALYYEVGARDEVEGKTGFAHLFEHLMFEGSAHVEKGAHFSLIAGLGGQINANTTHERTLYYASLPANQLDVVLWMEADRMRSLKVTEESFEHQRKTVLEERKQRVDNVPYGLAREKFSEMCFQGSPYSHPVIGYEADIVSASFRDVQSFHSSWYRPERATLSIAGDVDPEVVLRRAEEWFGDIPAGVFPRESRHHDPAPPKAQKAIVADPLARLSKVMISHPAPSYGQADFYAFEMAETILLRGPSSRAWRRLVLDEQLAVGLAGGFTARRCASRFVLSATVERPEHMDRVVEVWQREIDLLVSDGVSDSEWNKALNQIRASHIYSQQGILAQAISQGRYSLMLDDPCWDRDYLSALENLKVKEVLEVLRRYLDAGKRMEMHAVARGGVS